MEQACCHTGWGGADSSVGSSCPLHLAMTWRAAYLCQVVLWGAATLPSLSTTHSSRTPQSSWGRLCSCLEPPGAASLGVQLAKTCFPLLFCGQAREAAPCGGGSLGRRSANPCCPSPVCTHNSLGVHGELLGSFLFPALRQLCDFIWLLRRLG